LRPIVFGDFQKPFTQAAIRQFRGQNVITY
jgi:hypothetical protein